MSIRPSTLTFVFLILIAIGSVGGIGCGGPRAQDACDVVGFLCQDGSNALECQGGVWVALPCRGPAGCHREGNTVSCDMSANVDGDACASSAAGKGLCAADGKGTLECRPRAQGEGAVLTKTSSCSSCSVVGDKVVCQP